MEDLWNNRKGDLYLAVVRPITAVQERKARYSANEFKHNRVDPTPLPVERNPNEFF
jgi:hypothetical protein